MRIQIRRRRGAEIGESGTLSDLAFLLIIFFIVIAVFNVNQGFLLGLPRPDSKRIVDRQDLLRVELTSGGRIQMDGKTITLQDLTKKALAFRQSHPNMTFALRIDPDTPYQKVVDIVDLVRKLDIDNFSFTMRDVP